MKLKHSITPANCFAHCIEVVGVRVATREQMAVPLEWLTDHFGIEFGSENIDGVWYIAGLGSCFYFDRESDALMFYLNFVGRDNID